MTGGRQVNGKSKGDTERPRQLRENDRRMRTTRWTSAACTFAASMPAAAGEPRRRSSLASCRLGSREGGPPMLSQSDSTRDPARFTRPLVAYARCRRRRFRAFSRPCSLTRVHPRRLWPHRSPRLFVTRRADRICLAGASTSGNPVGTSRNATNEPLTHSWISVLPIATLLLEER
jgi:hypothetical protein